ncbi:MAG: hypothetical protein N3A62_01445, partial [Thermodesulfovibrionales bacterium]|nr:hypothetical protein [Thermodesulfovibrionales bacterium]
MELLRRIIFFGSFVLGILLYMYACLEPVVFVEILNPSDDKNTFIQRYSQSLLTQEEIRAIRDKKSAEVKKRTINIWGIEWDEVYNNLLILQNQRSLAAKNWNIPDKWKRRLPSDQYPSKVFFFKTTESLVNSIVQYINANDNQIYLHLTSRNIILKATYRVYSDDNFHLGSGFSSLPRPPNWILYPYRDYSLILFLVGLLAYIFLPYRTISKDALRYARWRVIAGDFAVFLLIAVFFSMPLFIAGGTVQAFTVGAPITIVMWLISLLGFYSIKISAWYASYQILPMDDGIKIATYKGVNLFRYDEMEYFQPVIFKPPKWLIVLTWLAALSGRGMVGRAILTSVSETGSIGIRLKNGKDLFVVVTDQMGT